MPTYQYRCRTCGRHFKITLQDSESEQVPECPYCQSQDSELDISSLFAPREQFAAAAKDNPTADGNCGSPGPFS